jgi:hypothetical protein
MRRRDTGAGGIVMNRKIAAGAAAGLVGGLAFDVAMRLIPPRSGGSMMTFAAVSVHATRALVGWAVYLIYGILIGALFGWLLDDQKLDELPAMLWGALYGVGWCILAGLILVPVLRVTWPFSPAAIDEVRNAAFPLLVGHVIYGAILGLVWSWITRRSPARRAGAADAVRGRAA